MKKKFYGLANREYNEWNGMFPTLGEAYNAIDRSKNPDRLTIKEAVLSFDELDMILEGEGTDVIWKRAES